MQSSAKPSLAHQQHANPDARNTLEGLEKARKNLLDLSARNRLINFKHSGSKILRIVDEVPDQIYQRLVQDAGDDAKSRFQLVPVPLPKRADYPFGEGVEPIDLAKVDIKSHARKLGLLNLD
jgi:hypothetical protein